MAGGEPSLAGISFYKKALDYQRRYSNGKKVLNTFQTNGVNFDERWADFLTENGFLVGVSIDGPQKIHDSFRVDASGKGSFERVVRVIELMRKRGTEFNTLTCIHGKNWMKGAEIYRFLKEIGSRFMQFIPIVERYTGFRKDGLTLGTPDDLEAKVTEWSVKPEQWGSFLISVFDEWVKEDVGRVFVQIFDMTLAGWVGIDPPLCVMSKECGKALIIEADGSIYSCDHFVYPEYYLGNIMERPLSEMVYSEFQINFGKLKSSLPQKCMVCKYLRVCNGGCIKHRFLKSAGHGNSVIRVNYLCDGYYRFFEYVSPYMEAMAKLVMRNLPPALVMDMFKSKQKEIMNVELQVSPNMLCPCGSGKKYKKCCGRLS